MGEDELGTSVGEDPPVGNRRAAVGGGDPDTDAIRVGDDDNGCRKAVA